MTDAIDNIKKRGRPKTGAVPVLVRIMPEQLARLDSWAEREGIPKARSEAIRRLVEKGLSE